MGPYEEENLPADVESIRESFHVEINGIPLAKEKIEISYVYLAEYPGHWLCNVTISFTAPLDGETKIVNSWPQELPVMAPGQPFMYNEFIIYMESISYWKGGRIGEFHLNIELPEDNPFDYTVQEDSAYDARMEDETLFKREGFFHENWCVKGSLRLDRENYSSQENFEVTLIDQYYSICYESLPWIDMPATSQKGWASSVYLILWVPVEEIKRERDWTAEEARFLVNLLFAWHGYRFQSDEWDSHFALYDWYEPCFESQEEARELFSPVELANLEYLLSLKN
ncbi:MAG: YARHG domain-containing protein [Spirochaetales bacterium]|nr:YARHG domain-containing protein [Spirochaetales bacterium]